MRTRLVVLGVLILLGVLALLTVRSRSKSNSPLAVENYATLLELKHDNLGIRSQPQRRPPGSRSAGSKNLHFPDPT